MYLTMCITTFLIIEPMSRFNLRTVVVQNVLIYLQRSVKLQGHIHITAIKKTIKLLPKDTLNSKIVHICEF